MRRRLPDPPDALLGRLPDGRPILAASVRFTAVTGGGPGGQNVNRRATKVELRVALVDLPLDADERALVRERLASRIAGGDELVVTASTERSQGQNRRIASARLVELLGQALEREAPRVATRTPRRAREARLTAKRTRSERLRGRRIDDR